MVALKALMLKTLAPIVKKQEPHLMEDLMYVYHLSRKGKHKMAGLLLYDEKRKGEVDQTMFLPMGPPIMYLTLTK